MAEETKCLKCGGRMKEGQLYIDVTSQKQEATTSSYMISSRFSSLDLPSLSERVSVEGPIWREEAEKEEGWIIKKKGKKNLQIKGMRCLTCGYIELYVKSD